VKVLVVHNRYRSFTPSGENVVVDSDIEALRERGVEVVTYIRASDEIDEWSQLKRTTLGMLPVYSPAALREIRVLIRREKPEASVSESTVRRYVAWKKRALGCSVKDICIAQSYAFGKEAQVDFHEPHASVKFFLPPFVVLPRGFDSAHDPTSIHILRRPLT